MSELQITEANSSCAFAIKHRDLLKNGIDYIMQPAIHNLVRSIQPSLLDLIMGNLTDDNNEYQVILTVKKLDIDDE